MATGPNPVLSHGLLFLSIDKETKNSVLHFAVEAVDEEHEALQMQWEVNWLIVRHYRTSWTTKDTEMSFILPICL